MSKHKKKPTTSLVSNKAKINRNMKTLSATASTELFGELSLQLQEKMNDGIDSADMEFGVDSQDDENYGSEKNEDLYPTSRIIKRDANGKIIVTEVGDEEEDPFLKFHNNSQLQSQVDTTSEEYNQQLLTFRNLYDNVYQRCVDTSSKSEFLETFKDVISTAEGEAVLNQLKVLLQIENGKPDFSKDQSKVLSGMLEFDGTQPLGLQRGAPAKEIFEMANTFYNKSQKELGNQNPNLKNAIVDNLHRIINTNPKTGLKDTTVDLNDHIRSHSHNQGKRIDQKGSSALNKKKETKKMSFSQLENLNNFFKELELKDRQKIMNITREDVFDAFSKFELKGHLDPFQVSGFQSLTYKSSNSFSTSDFLDDCTCCNGEAHFDYEKAARKIYDALYRSEKMKDESLTDVEFNIQMCNEREYNYKQQEYNNDKRDIENKNQYSSLPSYIASEEEAAAAINSQTDNNSKISNGVKSPVQCKAEMVDKCISWISANPTNSKLLKKTMSLLPLEAIYDLENMDDSTVNNPIDTISTRDLTLTASSKEVVVSSAEESNTDYFENEEGITNKNPVNLNFSADSFYNSLKSNLLTETVVDRQKQQYENLKKLSEIVWHNTSPDIADPELFLKEQKASLQKKEHEVVTMDFSSFEEKLSEVKEFVEKEGDITLPCFKESVGETPDKTEVTFKSDLEKQKKWGALDKVISVDYESFFRDLFKDDLASLVDIKPPNDEVGVYLKSISDDIDDENAAVTDSDERNYNGSISQSLSTELNQENNGNDQEYEEEEDDDNEEEDDEDDYSDNMFEDYEEKERIYNRCKSMIRFAVQFILKERLEHAAKEQEAEKSRLSLLKQLEEEEKGSSFKTKKSSKKKDKTKKKQQQHLQQHDEVNKKLGELKIEEQKRLDQEKEEKELKRREEQRKKAEELKKKRDEQLRKKKEEQAKRDEAEANARRLKEEQKKIKEDERKQKQTAKEKEKKLKQEQKEKEKKLREEEQLRKQKQEEVEKQAAETLTSKTTNEHTLPDFPLGIETSPSYSNSGIRRQSSLVPPQALQPYMSLLNSNQNVSEPLSSLLSLNGVANSSLEEPHLTPNGREITQNSNDIAGTATPSLSATFLTPPDSQGFLNNNISNTVYSNTNNTVLFNNAYNPSLQNNMYQHPDTSYSLTNSANSSALHNVDNSNTSQILAFTNNEKQNIAQRPLENSTNINTPSYGFSSVWNDNNINPLNTTTSGNGLVNQATSFNFQPQQTIINDRKINSGNTVASALSNYYSGLMQNYGSNANIPATQKPAMTNSILSPVRNTTLLATNNTGNSYVNANSSLHDLIYKSYIEYIQKNPLEAQPLSVLSLYRHIAELYTSSLMYDQFISQLELMASLNMANKYRDVIFLRRDIQGNVTNVWFDLSKGLYNNSHLSQQSSIWE